MKWQSRRSNQCLWLNPMVGDHKMQTNKDRGGVTSMGASTQIELGVSRLIGVCVCVCVCCAVKCSGPCHLETWAGDVVKRGGSLTSSREFWPLNTEWIYWWQNNALQLWVQSDFLKLKHCRVFGQQQIIICLLFHGNKYLKVIWEPLTDACIMPGSHQISKKH